jgi:hypothetical protein
MMLTVADDCVEGPGRSQYSMRAGVEVLLEAEEGKGQMHPWAGATSWFSASCT